MANELKGTRWNFAIEDEMLIGTPNENMIDYLKESIHKFTELCIKSEENMILQSTPTIHLVMLKRQIEDELERRNGRT